MPLDQIERWSEKSTHVCLGHLMQSGLCIEPDQILQNDHEEQKSLVRRKRAGPISILAELQRAHRLKRLPGRPRRQERSAGDAQSLVHALEAELGSSVRSPAP